MTESSTAKLAGYSLCLLIPLLTPLGVALDSPWLAPLIVLGLLPILGLVLGEDRSGPVIGLRRSRALVWYLENLPRIHVSVTIATLLWALAYTAQLDIEAERVAAVVTGTGIASAVAICTAHELLHHRSRPDLLLARVMTSFCLYGHMVVDHIHHHAKVGDPKVGSTAPRRRSAYRFALHDFMQGFRNAWSVESARLRRTSKPWWQNHVLQDNALAGGLAGACYGILGIRGLAVFAGQAVIAIFFFELITYIHHYGLVLNEGDEAGPQHAWAHHCWITNCLTFNNSFHSDHHLRPWTPYYELHALHGAPRLPASYVTMLYVALVPPLWFFLMDRRLDALEEAQRKADRELPQELRTQHCG